MSRREKGSASDISRERPGVTPQAMEDQGVALAMELALQKLRDGTASNQLICHFLKVGSSKEKLERDILVEQKKLVEAKTGSIQSAKKVDEMYAEAIEAMREYSGHSNEIEEEENEY